MVWRDLYVLAHFCPTNPFTMNPIAFIAFLMGINSTPVPARSNQADEPKKPETVQPAPDKAHGAPKRGGWDRN